MGRHSGVSEFVGKRTYQHKRSACCCLSWWLHDAGARGAMRVLVLVAVVRPVVRVLVVVATGVGVTCSSSSRRRPHSSPPAAHRWTAGGASRPATSAGEARRERADSVRTDTNTEPRGVHPPISLIQESLSVSVSVSVCVCVCVCVCHVCRW